MDKSCTLRVRRQGRRFAWHTIYKATATQCCEFVASLPGLAKVSDAISPNKGLRVVEYTGAGLDVEVIVRKPLAV